MRDRLRSHIGLVLSVLIMQCLVSMISSQVRYNSCISLMTLLLVKFIYYACMHARMYVCMDGCMYVCMHVCMHACM
jgi:uncharacterized membrane protein